jgi:hypothetical protein
MTKPTHFEIVTKTPNGLPVEETFATYEDAFTFLTGDPLLSSNANHPYFWGNFFEIVLCGGDGCTL